MTPFDFCLYVLGCFGLAFVVGHSAISEPIRLSIWDAKRFRLAARFLIAGLECPPCLSFWIGLIAGKEIGYTWPMSIWFGLVTSGAVLALGLVTGLIKRPTARPDDSLPSRF